MSIAPCHTWTSRNTAVAPVRVATRRLCTKLAVAPAGMRHRGIRGHLMRPLHAAAEQVRAPHARDIAVITARQPCARMVQEFGRLLLVPSSTTNLAGTLSQGRNCTVAVCRAPPTIARTLWWTPPFPALHIQWWPLLDPTLRPSLFSSPSVLTTLPFCLGLVPWGTIAAPARPLCTPPLTPRTPQAAAAAAAGGSAAQAGAGQDADGCRVPGRKRRGRAHR